MSCSVKTSPSVPTESNSHPRPTMPFSGSVHSSRSPPRRIFPPPNPAPSQVARSPAQSSLLRSSLRNRPPSSPRPHPPNPLSHPLIRYPLPAPPAPPHSCRSISLLVRCKLPPRYRLPALACSPDAADTDQCLYLPRSTRQSLHPTPDATAAFHKKSSHPPETAGSPRRSSHTRANVPPPVPPLREIHAIRAAGGTAQSLPNSAWQALHSVHSPAPPRLSPVAAAASALPSLLRAPRPLQSRPARFE